MRRANLRCFLLAALQYQEPPGAADTARGRSLRPGAIARTRRIAAAGGVPAADNILHVALQMQSNFHLLATAIMFIIDIWWIIQPNATANFKPSLIRALEMICVREMHRQPRNSRTEAVARIPSCATSRRSTRDGRSARLRARPATTLGAQQPPLRPRCRGTAHPLRMWSIEIAFSSLNDRDKKYRKYCNSLFSC